MFTGIIQKIGVVSSVRNREQTKTLEIRFTPWADKIKTGESIAVEGVCLTVKRIGQKSFTADAISTTLKATTLRHLKTGSRVNLERSLKWGERLGGHYVSGHVDQVGKILDTRKSGQSNILKIKAPQSIGKYLIPKGSIAVDGISLTIQKLIPGGFETAIIPHTTRKTTIGLKKAGDFVNLEADRMVKRFLKGKPQ